MTLHMKRFARDNYRVKSYHRRYSLVSFDAAKIDEQMLEYDSRKRLYERLIYQLQKQVDHLDNMAKECQLKRDELFDEILKRRTEFINAQEEFMNDWRRKKEGDS